MGQTQHKLCTVDSSTSMNDVVTAIESELETTKKRRKEETNHTIMVTNGEHGGWTVPCTANYQFVGLAGAIIRGPLPKCRGDLIFENIIFKNANNQSLDFYGNHIFRNCEFHIHINEVVKLKSEVSKTFFGIHIIGGSALFQNCIFRMTVRNVNVFVAIGVDHHAPGIILQAPIIDIKYRNISKLETFYVNTRSSTNTNTTYCEVYSGTIHYTNEQSHEQTYDGHCCQKRCSKKHCTKANCNCKGSHLCCSRKCRKRIAIRLFRGVGTVIASFQSNTVHFNKGNGFFNIAHGDSLIYLNGLTCISGPVSSWEVGKFHNILLSSFVSNLKYASEIIETHCLKHGSETSSTPSGSLIPVYSSKPDY